MLKINDTAYHPVYGHVTITENQTTTDHFIGCSFMLNNQKIDYVKLSIRSLYEKPSENKKLIWYYHPNLGLLKSSFKYESTDTFTAVTMGGSEIFVSTDSIREVQYHEIIDILKIKHLIK